MAARPIEERVGGVAVGESLGDRVPLQCFAHAADVADDIDQVAQRRGPQTDFDVGVARLAVLDAFDPVFDVVRGFRPLVRTGIIRAG